MGSTAPIHTIPSELLSEIFLTATLSERLIGDNVHAERKLVSNYASFLDYLAVSKYGDVPTTVSHICSYWRTLAKATPSLWSLILMSEKGGGFQKNRLWLLRSKDVELDVIFDEDINEHSNPAPLLQQLIGKRATNNRSSKSIRNFISQGSSILDCHIHRCRSLTFEFDRTQLASPDCLSYLKPFASLTCMRQLYLMDVDMSHLLDLLSCHETVQLSKVRIGNIFNIPDGQLTPMFKLLTSLTELELLEVDTTNWTEKPNLIYLPKLKTLTLRVEQGTWERIFFEIDAPNLRNLSIRGLSYADPLLYNAFAGGGLQLHRTLRQLTNLTIRELYVGAHEDHPWMYNYLDQLENLVLHLDDLDLKFVQCLEARRTLPNLKTLICHDIIKDAAYDIYLEEALKKRKASGMVLQKLVFHISNAHHPSWTWTGQQTYIPTPQDILEFQEHVLVVQVFRYRRPGYLWREMCTF